MLKKALKNDQETEDEIAKLLAEDIASLKLPPISDKVWSAIRTKKKDKKPKENTQKQTSS